MSSARFLRLGIVVVAAVLAGSIGFALAGSGIDVVVETWIDAPLDEVYEALIDEAARHGLAPAGPLHLEGRDKAIQHGGFDYTFGWLVLRKNA